MLLQITNKGRKLFNIENPTHIPKIGEEIKLPKGETATVTSVVYLYAEGHEDDNDAIVNVIT
jgi:hypothetical protein